MAGTSTFSPVSPALRADERSALPPSPAPAYVRTWSLALGVAIATWLSLTLTRSQDGVASVWIANGLLVGTWVLAPRDRWQRLGLVFVFATALVRLLVGDRWEIALGLTAINALESFAIADTIRRAVPDLRVSGQLKRLAQVSMASTFAACVVSATLATALLVGLGVGDAAVNWRTWFIAHLLGIVIVGTVTVTARLLGARVFGRAGRRVDFFACAGLLIATCTAVMAQQQLPALFMCYLPLALLTYRHGFAGVVSGTVVLAIAGGIAATNAWGPFGLVQDGSVTSRAVLLQLFVGAGCLLTYPTAIAMADRRFLERALAASQGQLQAVADNVPVHIAHLDSQERYTFANASLGRAVGLPAAEMIGKTVGQVRQADVYAQLQPHIRAALQGEPQTLEFHVGEGPARIDYRCQFVPDLTPDGSVRGFYSIAMDVSALKQAERELELLARTDPLTGLANRRQFEEAIAAAVPRAQRNGQPLLVLLFDIDHFKTINDTHGHAVGDGVIQEFARRLRECIYEVDLAARLGGDEFVVLIEYTPQMEVGEVVAARVVESLRAPMVVGSVTLQVSSSIGVGVHYPVRSAEHLLELADEALYAAKAAGRATWRTKSG